MAIAQTQTIGVDLEGFVEVNDQMVTAQSSHATWDSWIESNQVGDNEYIKSVFGTCL